LNTQTILHNTSMPLLDREKLSYITSLRINLQKLLSVICTCVDTPIGCCDDACDLASVCWPNLISCFDVKHHCPSSAYTKTSHYCWYDMKCTTLLLHNTLSVIRDAEFGFKLVTMTYQPACTILNIDIVNIPHVCGNDESLWYIRMHLKSSYEGFPL